MARYSVKFEIEVIVDEPEINEGEINEDILDTISDDAYNEIVTDAVNIIEDPENSVASITKIDDEEYEDDDDKSEKPWDYSKHFDDE